MKLIKSLLFIIGFLFILISQTSAQSSSKIYLFYGDGCSHCAAVIKYFEDENLFLKYPIEKKEINSDRDNAALLISFMDQHNIPQSSRRIPTVVLGDKIIIGDQPIINNFITEADLFLQKEKSISPTEEVQEKQEASQSVNLTVGKNAETTENIKPVDLTIFAVIAGSLVDAINPCAFAVLIILMTTIMATGNAKKALKAGSAFSASIFISYFLMGLGLYTALGIGSISYTFYKIVGWLAILLGLLNLKDYFWYGKGFLMEVPLSWRPKLKSLIHSVMSPIGAFAVGFLVSLFLLPCTSGPYIVILGMLAKKTHLAQAVSYLLLYNLIFITPMLLITLAVYKGFNISKMEEARQKNLRVLHLIAGIILLVMGFVVLKGWI